MKPVLFMESETAYVELTLRCYCRCPWCYKGSEVHSKGRHVPLEVIKARLDWLSKFTNVKSVGWIGGEPGLYPWLREASEYALERGFVLKMTTSGKFGNMGSNLEYILDLYRRGLLSIDLSCQPGQNDKEYELFVRKIKESFSDRRVALKKLGFTVYVDLRTMVAVSEGLAGDEKVLEKLLRRILPLSGYSTSDSRESCKKIAGLIGKSYLPFDLSSNWFYRYYRETDYTGFRHTIEFMSVSSISKVDGRVMISTVKGHVCGMGRSQILQDQIQLPSMLIRSDGEMMFVVPHCIPAKFGLCNVELHTEAERIYEETVKSLKRIGTILFLANRKKAADNCSPDGVETPCTECPLDKTCESCHVSERVG